MTGGGGWTDALSAMIAVLIALYVESGSVGRGDWSHIVCMARRAVIDHAYEEYANTRRNPRHDCTVLMVIATRLIVLRYFATRLNLPLTNFFGRAQRAPPNFQSTPEVHTISHPASFFFIIHLHLTGHSCTAARQQRILHHGCE
jgi:hypothetical protein